MKKKFSAQSAASIRIDLLQKDEPSFFKLYLRSDGFESISTGSKENLLLILFLH